jgi:thioredoxin reductase (NADPH)
VNQPNSTQAKRLTEQMKTLAKEMAAQQADPGGIEGIGLPGGPRDLLIVGAGPAGLMAAINGPVEGLDTLMIDARKAPGGQSSMSSRIENYGGFPVGIPGEQLAARLHEQAQRVGADSKLGVRVTGMTVDPETEIKTVTLSNGEKIEARAVLISGGVEVRRLPSFPGDHATNIIYQTRQQVMREGAGKHVVIIGGSNGAAQAALAAVDKAESVTLVARSALVKSMSDYQISALHSQPKVRIIEGDELASLTVDDFSRATAMKLKSGRQLPVGVVGVFIGGEPDLKWLPKNIKIDDGRVVADVNYSTNIPGVFVAGDIRKGSFGRVGTAAAEGQIAARAAWFYLEQAKIRPKAKK